MEYVKICENCGEEFVAKRPYAQYCRLRECKAERMKKYPTPPPVPWDKSPRNCEHCNNEYTPKSPQQKYCSKECQLVETHLKTVAMRTGPFEEKRKCENCGEEYIARSATSKWCNGECARIGSNQRERELRILKKTKRMKEGCGIYTPSHFDDLIFYNEEQFHHWFEENFSLYGLAKIHKSNRLFPDIIAETHDGKVIRIELEYFASNFEKHEHDAELCDLIICYVKKEGTESIKGLPVISMFDIPRGRDYNWQITNMNDKSLTCYFINIVNTLNNNLNQYMKNNVYCKRIELCDYIQLYSKISA